MISLLRTPFPKATILHISPARSLQTFTTCLISRAQRQRTFHGMQLSGSPGMKKGSPKGGGQWFHLICPGFLPLCSNMVGASSSRHIRITGLPRRTYSLLHFLDFLQSMSLTLWCTNTGARFIRRCLWSTGLRLKRSTKEPTKTGRSTVFREYGVLFCLPFLPVERCIAPGMMAGSTWKYLNLS